jgi:chromosome segregation ATPase
MLGPRLWSSVQGTQLQRPFNALRCWSDARLEALTHPERLADFEKEIRRCRAEMARTQADTQLVLEQLAKLNDQLHLIVTETQRLNDQMESHREMSHASFRAIIERSFQEPTIGNKRYSDDGEMGGKLKRRRSSTHDVVDAATTLMGFANAANAHLPRQIAI